jgi:hypothetical protein
METCLQQIMFPVPRVLSENLSEVTSNKWKCFNTATGIKNTLTEKKFASMFILFSLFNFVLFCAL